MSASIIIGAIIILVCFYYFIYTLVTTSKEINCIKKAGVTTINDISDIVDEISNINNQYRHHVALNGVAQSDEYIIAPFSKQEVCYYQDKCIKDNEGKSDNIIFNFFYELVLKKFENEIVYRNSQNEVFITDPSSNKKIYIDVESFERSGELYPVFNRKERKNSSWIKSNFPNTSDLYSSDCDYLFKEDAILEKQPLYIIGEIYKIKEKTFIGASLKKGLSLLTYKPKQQLIKELKSKIYSAVTILISSLIFAALLVIISM